MSFYYDHEFDNGDGGKTSDGKCVELMYSNSDGREYVCNREASSALHPPDQFRHWCSSLEQGYDCMCFEHEDYDA